MHQGRTPHGIDCVGVPIWVMQSLGVMPDELRQANYSRLSNGELIATCQRLCVRLDRDEPGCLVVFKWPGEKEAGHVAIRTELRDGRPGLIHAYRNQGGVKEHGFGAPWPRLVDSYWRLPGVER